MRNINTVYSIWFLFRVAVWYHERVSAANEWVQNVKVQNDILTSIDQHGVVILVMLDLSAAFDTIDHDQNGKDTMYYGSSTCLVLVLPVRLHTPHQDWQVILWVTGYSVVRTTGISVRTIVVPDAPTPWKTYQKAWFRASHICRRHTALYGNKTHHSTSCGYRSTSKNLLCEPRNNMKTYGDRSFSACAPKLWNQPLKIIRAAGSVAIFKRQLKIHHFKDVFIK